MYYVISQFYHVSSNVILCFTVLIASRRDIGLQGTGFWLHVPTYYRALASGFTIRSTTCHWLLASPSDLLQGTGFWLHHPIYYMSLVLASPSDLLHVTGFGFTFRPISGTNTIRVQCTHIWPKASSLAKPGLCLNHNNSQIVVIETPCNWSIKLYMTFNTHWSHNNPQV